SARLVASSARLTPASAAVVTNTRSVLRIKPVISILDLPVTEAFLFDLAERIALAPPLARAPRLLLADHLGARIRWSCIDTLGHGLRLADSGVGRASDGGSCVSDFCPFDGSRRACRPRIFD